MLTDGQDGPAVAQIRDVPGGGTPLDPPAVTMPAANTLAEKTPAKATGNSDPRTQVIPLVLCGIGFAAGAVLIAKAQRRQRR